MTNQNGTPPSGGVLSTYHMKTITQLESDIEEARDEMRQAPQIDDVPPLSDYITGKQLAMALLGVFNDTEAEVLHLSNHLSDSYNVTKNFSRHAIACIRLFARKQADYGPRNIAEMGLGGMITRISDKYYRLRHLVEAKSSPQNESTIDTCRDLAVYALITLMVINEQWPEGGAK